MRNFAIVICLILFISGCKFLTVESKKTVTVGNPTAAEILGKDHEADIFQYNNLIYINASQIEWIQEDTYEKGPKIAEIIKQSMDSDEFTDGTASKLPIGTKVFQVVGNGQLLLMVEKDDREIVYLAQIEG
jgi:hypothetical protein